MSKIVEKCIYKQLYHYFQQNNMFYAHQYGFRTGHCTEYSALEIIDRVTTQFNIKDISLNIFLDLSKAFDSLHWSCHFTKQIKILWSTVIPLYNTMVGVHDIKARYKWGAL